VVKTNPSLLTIRRPIGSERGRIEVGVAGGKRDTGCMFVAHRIILH
jgi:hypothetical protein